MQCRGARFSPYGVIARLLCVDCVVPVWAVAPGVVVLFSALRGCHVCAGQGFVWLAIQLVKLCVRLVVSINSQYQQC